MPTTPGQLTAAMRERNTPAADRLEEEIEAVMEGLTELESDGSFEYQSKLGTLVNPTVLKILNDRYGRPDHSGWVVEFHEPDLVQLTPQQKPPQ